MLVPRPILRNLDRCPPLFVFCPVTQPVPFSSLLKDRVDPGGSERVGSHVRDGRRRLRSRRAERERQEIVVRSSRIVFRVGYVATKDNKS